MTPHQIINIISSIRSSHPDMEDLYMNGQCYNFYLILRSIFPQSMPYYDHNKGHMYTKIDRYWYDIRGIHYKVADSCTPYTYDGHKPHRWGKSDRRRLIELNRQNKEVE